MCVRACTSARVCMWDRKEVRACCRRCWQRRREKKKTIRRKEWDKEKLSSGKIEFEKLVANAEPSTVLHRQAHKAAPCSAEAEVDSPNNINGKLGLYPDPRHDNRVRPIPLCGKAACQAFLVRGVFPMEDGICGTDQWCKRAAHVLAGAGVLPLLCFCCLPGDGIPRWSLVTGCIGIYDAVIKQCHPVTLPDTTCGPVGLKCGSGVAIIGRNEHRLDNDSSPCEICQLCVFWSFLL